MSLLAKLRADQLAARKEHNEVATGLLTALVGEAARIGKDNGNRESTDDEVVRVIKKFLDNAKETRDLLAKMPKPAGAGLTGEFTALNKANVEIRLLESYMPKQMTEAELRAAVVAFKAEKPDAKMGDIMAHLKANFAGLYDGKVASQIAKDA